MKGVRKSWFATMKENSLKEVGVKSGATPARMEHGAFAPQAVTNRSCRCDNRSRFRLMTIFLLGYNFECVLLFGVSFITN